MAKDIFESSDTVRTAQPLRHAQSVTLGAWTSRSPAVDAAGATAGQLQTAIDASAAAPIVSARQPCPPAPTVTADPAPGTPLAEGCVRQVCCSMRAR